MPEVELSAGVVEYGDTGGEGLPMVFLPGLAMDGRKWAPVTSGLRSEYRCLTPVLPFGAHRQPMRADADLSLRGMGRLVTEFLERLDLRDVVLCFNDWGGAQVMVADGGMDRVGRLVLVSCETAGNYPPRLAGHAAWLSCQRPGGLQLMRQTLLRSWLPALSFVVWEMSKRRIPDELVAGRPEPRKRPADLRG